jgi:HAD superfamily hydrolase (TIGR01662 family)
VTLRAVLFDVDFTLAKPGPELMPEGYVRCGERHGLALEAARYEAARDAALLDLKRHPELDHDEEIWVAFTERIVLGMGGSEPVSHDIAVELTSRWTRHENFELYEDVMPVLDELRRVGLKIGLVSNSARDVREFAEHHALDIDAGISSFHHGKSKPHASIFRAVLDLLEVVPGEAAMVGDTVVEDIEGALAIGMRAVLVDRLGLFPDYDPRIDDLLALPAALGLPRGPAPTL